MRNVEIAHREGFHYVVVDGKEWSRHDNLEKAEEARVKIVVSQVQREKKSSVAGGRDFQRGPQIIAQAQEKGPALER